MKTLGSAEGHWVNTGSEYINTEYSDSAVGMFVEPLRRHTCLLAPTMPRIPGKAGDEDTRLAPESSFGRRGGRVGRRFGCDGQHAGRKKSGTRCEASDNAKGPAGFARGRDGSTTIETALAISVLVALFAGLLAIVQERYSADRLARAARAAAPRSCARSERGLLRGNSARTRSSPKTSTAVTSGGRYGRRGTEPFCSLRRAPDENQCSRFRRRDGAGADCLAEGGRAGRRCAGRAHDGDGTCVSRAAGWLSRCERVEREESS